MSAGDEHVGSSVGPAYLARPTRSEEGCTSSPLHGGGGVPAYRPSFYVLTFQSETVGNSHMLTRFLGGKSIFDKFDSDWPPTTMALQCGDQLMCLLVRLF